LLFEADDWSEDGWQMSDAGYGKNLSAAEAYNDLHLQPSVVMKRLCDQQYVMRKVAINLC